MKTTTLVLVLMCCCKPVQAEDVINIGRFDFDGSIKVTGLQVINDRYAWDIVASSDRWTEVDLGLNFLHRSWIIQPMVGLDFSRNDVGKVECGSIIPQLYLIRYGRTHEETWYVGTIPVAGGATQHGLRQLVTHRPHGSPLWIGGQYDLALSSGLTPEHFVGPMVERKFTSTSWLGLTVQWNPNGESRYLLTCTWASIPLF